MIIILLSSTPIDFIEFKFAEIGGSLLELKCRSQSSITTHSRYLECLRTHRYGISEAAESLSRSNSANNDTFDDAAEFIFKLVISLQNPSHQNNSRLFSFFYISIEFRY